MEPTTLLFLVAAAFVAAFVDSIVGGGGLITLPALLATGMPAHQALGTNKLAATGASGMASLQYVRHGVVVGRLVLVWVPFSLGGSALGAATVLQVPGDWVRGLVLVVMAAMAAFVLLRPRFGQADRVGAVGGRLVAGGALLAFVVGFYDGFLGPGTGSFLLFGLVGLGFGFLRAAGQGRVLNFASNLSALVYFALRGQVDYAVGLPMMGAMVTGGYAGSRFGIRHGVKWIRPLFLGMTLALMARLAWDFFR